MNIVYHLSYQCLIDSTKAHAGKGKWKITPYSKTDALVEYFQNGKWVAQGSVDVAWLKPAYQGGV